MNLLLSFERKSVIYIYFLEFSQSEHPITNSFLNYWVLNVKLIEEYFIVNLFGRNTHYFVFENLFYFGQHRFESVELLTFSILFETTEFTLNAVK